MKIYVTGRSCRLPGAPDTAGLENVLFGKRDTVTSVPQDRWLHAYFLHPVPGTKGKTYTFAAGIVPSLWAFDAAVFGISPREAGQMDPQQRMLLHVVWEALEDWPASRWVSLSGARRWGMPRDWHRMRR
ncbi:MAG: beta-ketoacyl synthase N-terminal-like domain-containing protein [Rhodobacterales bacterium]|nr:beta-ketoacyl synthase N-terminal-like domain-containing protein [Rhodobacterales bacterium]